MVLFVRPRGALNSPCLRFPARADNEKWDILGSIETECSGSLTEDAFVAGALSVFHNFSDLFRKAFTAELAEFTSRAKKNPAGKITFESGSNR